MDVHKFFPAQEPQPEELTTAVEDTVNNLARRVSTLMQPGIVPANKLYAETGDARWNLVKEFVITQNLSTALAIDVSSGCAFNTANERICIAPAAADPHIPGNPTAVDNLGNSISKSTGNQGMLLPDNSTCYIYIKYLQATDTATASGGAPAGGYTVDPDTGALDYVHRIDGYELFYATTPSVNADDIYLGTVVTGDTAVSTIDMATASPARQFAHISSALVKAVVADGATYPVTTAYVSGQTVDMSEHVRCVLDPAKVSPSNPHGVNYAKGNVPDLDLRFGPYSDNPANFQSNGIVALDADRPGPLYPDPGVAGGYPTIRLALPVAGQYAYVLGHEYDVTNTYYSEVWTGSAIAPNIEPSELRVDFPLGQPIHRAQGFYYICLKEYTVGADVFPAATAILASGSPVLGDLERVLQGEDASGTPYLTNSETYIPIGVLYFSPVTGFASLTDPQTGQTGLNVIDIRKWGVMGELNMAHEKRLYSVGGNPATDVIQWKHNMRLLKRDLTLLGNGTAGTEGGNLKIVNGTVNLDSASTVDSYDANITVRNRDDVADTATVFLPGEIKMYGGAVAPPGWLLCDGTTYTWAQHIRLRDVVGVTFGGTTSVDWKVPDMRGRFPVGAGTHTDNASTPNSRTFTLGKGDGTDGGAPGEYAHKLLSEESGLPAHQHLYLGTWAAMASGGSNQVLARDAGGVDQTANVAAAPAASAHNTVPPYLAVNFIIKT